MKTAFSIIVLCANNEHIGLVVQQLLDLIQLGDEIIVVDDHSPVHVKAILQNFRSKIKIIKSDRHSNRSHNRNLGASIAQNNVLLFVDGDMILADDALEELRRAHIAKKGVAMIGARHGTSYTEQHMTLYSSIDNYIKLIETSQGREVICLNPLFRDRRESFFQNTAHRPYYWIQYYTGASTVTREIFEKIGGFDESFNTWGAEDIDFGYRVSKFGNIVFLPHFHSIHIPHPRNILKVESSNAKNILYMLKKYQTWEFEVLYCFKAISEVFSSILQIILQMRLLDLAPISQSLDKDSAIIDTISKTYPNGRMSYYSQKSKKCELFTMGLATNFHEKCFNKVFVSDNVFIYPPLITSRILQEAYRVGKTVLIVKSGNSIRIDWTDKMTIPTYHSNSRLTYRSDDIMDFSFYEEDGAYRVTSDILDYKYSSYPKSWED